MYPNPVSDSHGYDFTVAVLCNRFGSLQSYQYDKGTGYKIFTDRNRASVYDALQYLRCRYHGLAEIRMGITLLRFVEKRQKIMYLVRIYGNVFPFMGKLDGRYKKMLDLRKDRILSIAHMAR